MDKLLSRLWQKIQRIGVCLFGFLCLFNQGYSTPSTFVEGALQNLSYAERFVLRSFFCSFLKQEDLGHVVFFNRKPACFFAIDKKCRQTTYHHKLLLKGWRCWKKYEYLFQHPNFILLEEEFVIGDERVLHIFLINKTTLLSLLHTEDEFFKKALGAEFSAEHFVHSIETTGVLRPSINYDDALLGIILGFGNESSVAFKKQHDLLKDDSQIPEWDETYRGVEAICPKKCTIHPVGFIGNPKSTEVITLLQGYTEELEAIWNMTRLSKDPLKLILNKLCEK
jgi:hypothetical protein